MKFHDHQPKMQKNPLLILSSAVSALAAAALWFVREPLGLDVSDMLMLSGISLLIIILTVRDHFTKKENYAKALELKIQQEDMANEDFSDNSFFYD